MIFFEKKDESGEIYIRNTDPKKSYDDYQIREFETKTGKLALYTDDKDLIVSSRFFSRFGKIVGTVIEEMHLHFAKKIDVNLHTLRSIQGKLKQKVEQIVQNPLLSHIESYSEKKAVVIEKVKAEPERVAEVLLFLNKKIFELSAHMSSFELLHMGKSIKPDFSRHNIRRLILGVVHGFEELFDNKRVRLRFHFSDDFANTHKLNLDYKTMNAALYNFFDNTAKYVLPGSYIDFDFTVDENNFSILIKMMSVKIEIGELDKIYELGYRSENGKEIETGTGIGMFVLKKAFELNNINIKIIPDYKISKYHSESEFVLNCFKISGSL